MAEHVALAPEQPPERPGYRGRCLYKTGKCTNERALKTSGAAHNLCEEHRNRQNQHQRKLDAKNRVARKDKRGGKQPGDAPRAAAARFAPYPTAAPSAAAAGAKKRSASLDAAEMVALAPITPSTAAASAQQQQPLPPSVAGLHGLALAPGPHAAMPGDAAASAAAGAAAAAANSAGMVYLPNGPQPPQLAYPFVMQDFDGIVVPLPSYLEGQDRIEFRARIYQKVLDFISEECILRFSGAGARVPSDSSSKSHAVATNALSATAADRATGSTDSTVAPARSVSSGSSSSSSSTATEASTASPPSVVAAEDPTGADASAGAASSRRPSDSNDQTVATADASSAGSGTPNSGAPKRLKRSARS